MRRVITLLAFAELCLAISGRAIAQDPGGDPSAIGKFIVFIDAPTDGGSVRPNQQGKFSVKGRVKWTGLVNKRESIARGRTGTDKRDG